MEATAERMQAAVQKLKSKEIIPEGDGYQELVNVLRLLKLDRHAEARERLEHWLNRNHYYWRLEA